MDDIINSMENEELTPDEVNALKSFKPIKTKDLGGKLIPEVSPQEYYERLQEAMGRDAYLMNTVKQERIDKALKEWKKRIGPRFAEATTVNPVITDRVKRVESGQGLHKTSIVLSGDLGIGKTYTAYAFINMLIAAGAVTPGQVIADTETAILGKISSSGFKRVELIEELLNPRYKIYYIDDVGQGYFSNEQARKEVWYELIDHVYSHDLTLIMTTNKAFQNVQGKIVGSPALEQWIGGAAYDRLKHLVGQDGLIVPGNVNRRPGVFETREEKYNKS